MNNNHWNYLFDLNDPLDRFLDNDLLRRMVDNLGLGNGVLRLTSQLFIALLEFKITGIASRAHLLSLGGRRIRCRC
jgi:hypothetical protein